MRSFINWLHGPDLTPKERSARNFKRAAITYLVIMLMTFGYNSARYPKYTGNVPEMNPFLTSLASVTAAVAWPFYWTWEGFSAIYEPTTTPSPPEKVLDRAKP